jgi:uridine kinase
MVKIIGIQGIAGSGKTTLTQALGKALNATTLFWDDFDPISTGPSDYVEWFKTSKDHNDWKYDALAETMKSLKEEKSLTCPATHRVLIPTKYIIFDAPLGYDHKATGQWINFLIYLDTPPDIALARRLYRDYQPHAKRNDNDILEEISDYLESARPVFMAAYEMKNTADLILDGSQPIETLVSTVLSVLDKRKI